jgi:hypothetical protein
MSLKRLTAFVVLVELIGLGVLFSFLIGAIVANGGRITFDMSYFNEMWIEYLVILATVGIAPYALYVGDHWMRSSN